MAKKPMSWKFGGVYFKKDYSSNINALFDALEYDCSFTGQEVSLEEATRSSFRDSAVAIKNGYTLLHDNRLPYDCAFEAGKWFEMDEVLAKTSAQTDILCFFLDGITSTYGLSLFSKGKRVRCRGVFNDKMMIDEGVVLPGETGGEERDEENRLFNVMETFTGSSFSELINDKGFQLLHYKSTPRKA